MGLFSSKKIITVSSTIYNMAGDENDRPDFLKGTLFGAVMADSPSLASEIQGSYFNGPGMKQRQFFRWADRNDLSSLPQTTVQNTASLNATVVAGEIPISPSPAGLQLSLTQAEVADGEFESFIEKWVLENYPERHSEDWLGEYEPETATFSVQFPNGDFYSWINNGEYDVNKRYVVGRYFEYLDESEQPIEEGTVTNITTLPDLTGFTQSSDTGSFTPVTFTRNRTTIWSYNNGDPNVTHEDNVSADVSGELNTAEEVWERIEYVSGGTNQEGERQIWNFTGTEYVTNDYTNTVVTTTDLGGGVIRTETSTTIGEQGTDRWDSRYDTQFVSKGSVIGGEQVFIYEVGSGNTTLDALVSDVDASGIQEFFPFLPVRLNNVSILADQYDEPPTGNGLYKETNQAYRKAFQNKPFKALVESVEDNESIGDIDYAYVMFGCSLNVEENACKKYIYKFMENMIPYQNSGSGNAMSQMATRKSEYDAALADYETWENTDWSNTPWSQIPPKPVVPKITPPSVSTIRLNTPGLPYDIRLNWVHIEIEQFSGNYDADPNVGGNQTAKVDDFLITPGPAFTWTERTTFNTRNDTQVRYRENSIPSMYIYWQVDSNTYRRLQVWGFIHQNYIYGGKAVTISSTEALLDTEESGFVIPLHYPTMSDMNIVDYTQMATANTHILFNSYEVTKQKWYQRGIFKVLLIIAIIVVAVVVFPGAFAAGGGILGGNLAIGSALGLAGTAALVAGVVANYIAAIIISQVLSFIGTEMFGEKWGAIFAAIAGFALSMGISGTSLFSAEGLLGLGNAVANGYAGWVRGDIMEMQENLEGEFDEYENRMEKIQELIDSLGGNNLNFNPLFLTDSQYGNGRRRGGSKGYLPETLDQYISRTTMTGTDVVDLTHSMVYNFVDVQQTLPRN